MQTHNFPLASIMGESALVPLFIWYFICILSNYTSNEVQDTRPTHFKKKYHFTNTQTIRLQLLFDKWVVQKVILSSNVLVLSYLLQQPTISSL